MLCLLDRQASGTAGLRVDTPMRRQEVWLWDLFVFVDGCGVNVCFAHAVGMTSAYIGMVMERVTLAVSIQFHA